MTLSRSLFTAALLALVPALAWADIALPKGALAEPGPAERRTGRVPATITVTPAGAASAPTHLIVTVPREMLRQVMGPIPVAGSLGDAGPSVPAPPGRFPERRLRHVVIAVALALALASLPLAVAGRRRTAAAVGMALLLGGVIGSAAASSSAEAPGAPLGPPRTVEFVIVPGKGPVRVEARYSR